VKGKARSMDISGTFCEDIRGYLSIISFYFYVHSKYSAVFISCHLGPTAAILEKSPQQVTHFTGKIVH
jgi:hypothetical protein